MKGKVRIYGRWDGITPHSSAHDKYIITITRSRPIPQSILDEWNKELNGFDFDMWINRMGNYKAIADEINKLVNQKKQKKLA